jgi:hypothetical protein
LNGKQNIKGRQVGSNKCQMEHNVEWAIMTNGTYTVKSADGPEGEEVFPL